MNLMNFLVQKKLNKSYNVDCVGYCVSYILKMVLRGRDGHKETLHYGLCMSSPHTDFTDHSSVLVDLLTPVQFLDLNNNHYITGSKT